MYHVQDLEDFPNASKEELQQDLHAAEGLLQQAIGQTYFSSYEAGQEHEAFKDSIQRRIDFTRTELSRRS